LRNKSGNTWAPAGPASQSSSQNCRPLAQSPILVDACGSSIDRNWNRSPANVIAPSPYASSKPSISESTHAAGASVRVQTQIPFLLNLLRDNFRRGQGVLMNNSEKRLPTILIV